METNQKCIHLPNCPEATIQDEILELKQYLTVWDEYYQIAEPPDYMYFCNLCTRRAFKMRSLGLDKEIPGNCML